MRTVELNIRLDVHGQDNSASSIARREVQCLATLGECFHHRSDYLDHGALVPRLVVRLDAAERAALLGLAAELHQDCIAVYNPDQGHGELLGPSAAAWGEFDLSRFQRLDMVTVHGESTGLGWAAVTSKYMPPPSVYLSPASFPLCLVLFFINVSFSAIKILFGGIFSARPVPL